METTPSHSQQDTAPKSDANAFARLVSLPAGTSKETLMQTIDEAVTQVLSDLSNHEKGALPADILMKVQTSLSFLEQCLSFHDTEFTSFAKRRANELQSALNNTLERLKKPKAPAPQPETPKTEEVPAPVQDAAPEPVAEPAPEEEPVDPNAFLYEREEKVLIEFAFERLKKRLAFMRGDSVKVEKGKAIETSGIHEDGVAPFFLLSPQFPDILYPAFCDLIHEKRNLLSRRIYIHTNKEQTDEEVRTLYEENHTRDMDGIIGLGFDDWAGEIAKAGVGGLPQEIRKIGPKKEEKNDGIGASLKKVFSFGGGDKKKKKETTQHVEIPDTTPIRIHKEWQSLENRGVIDLSQHFSYSLISYAMQLSEKQFETEYECIAQIVNQQDTPDVGPVITNLNRLYKFYDNIFFDLVILVLFQRTNKFDINMLQAACMSQNFVVDRLPLCMDELRRRPMDHAKHLVAVLKDGKGKDAVKQALKDYFHVHETVHSSKVGKRIQASENLLKRQKDKMDSPTKEVLEEVLHIFREVNNLKTRQEEEGTFLGDEILDTVAEGIDRAVANL